MISVIIALYNAENVIGRCIESVYASSYTDYEVIVVDDGSTDKTSFIVQSSMWNGQVKYLYEKKDNQD